MSRASLDFLLSRPGVAVGIVVGGAAEALDSAPGSYRLTLLRRTGFVRVALRHGWVLLYARGRGQASTLRGGRMGGCTGGGP